jgi:hypothetical protein
MVLENLVQTIGKSKLPDHISNPKGSREFQQFIKLGSKEHRNCAIEALCKQVPDLAMRNIYALLTLEKIVTYGLKSDESFTSDKFLKPVMTDRKTVEQLFFHKLGCKFLNKLYLHPAIKPSLKKQMLQIILVPRSIEVLGPSKEKLRQYYLETAKKCIDKELLGLEFVQRFFKQAVSDFPVAEDLPFNEEFLAMAADGLPHLLSSRDGVIAVVKLLGVATAKHKKNFIKELKGKFAEMAKNSVTSVAILRLFDSVDDTVLIGKSVLSELVGSDYAVGLDLMQDPIGRIPFLYILEGLEMKSGRCYLQQDRLLLAESPLHTAMKDKESRKSELATKCVPSILKIVRNHMSLLVQTDSGKDLVLGLIRTSDEKEDLINQAIDSLQDGESIGQPFVSMLNALLKEFPELSAKRCWSNIVASLNGKVESLAPFATGLGSYVVMNLLKSSNVSKSVKGALLAIQKQIDSVEEPNKGLEIIKTELANASSEDDVMVWDETVKTFAVEKTRKRSAEKSSKISENKKSKTLNEDGTQNLFDDDEDDEMWGIVGDDDEFNEEGEWEADE